MFHTAITSAILHLSHRKKMAFRIRLRTNFGMSNHQVWIWSRSSEGAPNNQLDASTYLPLLGSWVPTNDLGPIRTATRELGVRTLFKLDQQLRTSKGRDQTSLDQHTATLIGFIGGRPASLTIEALEAQPVSEPCRTEEKGLTYDDILIRQGPYWHEALMCAIANNINLVGQGKMNVCSRLTYRRRKGLSVDPSRRALAGRLCVPRSIPCNSLCCSRDHQRQITGGSCLG